ncbi:MAG TPA: hypothetical protein VNL73_05180 [Verrucomicrobiae bacterium]|nr:hypothetical protein [Verrucomicrobiae bacterium]
MNKIVLYFFAFLLWDSLLFAQTLPSFSSKLLLPKNLVPAYSRMNSQTSQARFNTQIFSRPYGVSAFVYNDDPTCTQGNIELIGVADANWDRCWVYKKDGGGEDMAWQGEHGTNSFQFASPRGIAFGWTGGVYVSDAYNNRTHVYTVDACDVLNVQFVRFDSLGEGTPLKEPRGIDEVEYKVQGSVNPNLVAQMYAVADYGNNRIVIFPGGRVFPGPTETRFQFNKPTAVAYAWDKTTGMLKNHLYVVSQGNGDIYWLQMNNTALYTNELVVEKAVRLDFDWLVFTGQALANYFLSSATVDNHGMLWILDSNNGMVYKFWPAYMNSSDTLVLVGSWGGIGTVDSLLNYPNAIEAEHGAWVDHCGGNPGCPNNQYPLANLHDIFVTETWGPTTGIRRFSIGVEAYVDSFKYIARGDSGTGNAVNWWHHFTDYVRITEQVFKMPQNTLVQTVSNNVEIPPKSSYGGLWVVGANDSGTYKVKITSTSLYGDAVDIDSFTVFVDTTLRNHSPTITQFPRFVHPEWTCFFPSDSGIGLGPLNWGGDFVKVTATDPDNDPLTYTWTIIPSGGSVGADSRHAGYGSYSTLADSVFYGVPNNVGRAGNPGMPTTDCDECLFLRITDPAENFVKSSMGPGKPTCLRGDVDANGIHTPADVVLLLKIIFSDIAPPPYGDYHLMADINCDNWASPADAVLFLQMVFQGAFPPC